MKIYVLRHGETKENETGIMQGNMDTLLSKKGIKQCLELHEKLKDLKIDIAFVSPKKRTRKTFDIVFPNVKKIYDDRLLSRNHGEFEGLRRDQININEYWNIKLNKKYKKAENVRDLFNRVESLLNEVKENYNDKTVLLVTHSGICGVLYYYFNGIPDDGNLMEYNSHNCTFEEYEL